MSDRKLEALPTRIYWSLPSSAVPSFSAAQPHQFGHGSNFIREVCTSKLSFFSWTLFRMQNVWGDFWLNIDELLKLWEKKARFTVNLPSLGKKDYLDSVVAFSFYCEMQDSLHRNGTKFKLRASGKVKWTPLYLKFLRLKISPSRPFNFSFLWSRLPFNSPHSFKNKTSSCVQMAESFRLEPRHRSNGGSTGRANHAVKGDQIWVPLGPLIGCEVEGWSIMVNKRCWQLESAGWRERQVGLLLLLYTACKYGQLTAQIQRQVFLLTFMCSRE